MWGCSGGGGAKGGTGGARNNLATVTIMWIELIQMKWFIFFRSGLSAPYKMTTCRGDRPTSTKGAYGVNSSDLGSLYRRMNGNQSEESSL